MNASACLSRIRPRLRLLALVPVVIITYIVTLIAVDEFFFGANRIIINTIPIERVGTQGQSIAHTENEDLESLESAPLDFERVTNKTLGFEKVIAIGLPERSDKRDALELMASLTGFDIEWVDGVRPSSIPNKAIPYGIDPSAIRDNFLGSWRGHMNAIRRVVEQEVGSALIIEDDMDWDINLKSQLRNIAHGARQLLHQSSALPHSPYGDDWDILWLGHCGEPFPETLEENKKSVATCGLVTIPAPYEDRSLVRGAYLHLFLRHLSKRSEKNPLRLERGWPAHGIRQFTSTALQRCHVWAG